MMHHAIPSRLIPKTSFLHILQCLPHSTINILHEYFTLLTFFQIMQAAPNGCCHFNLISLLMIWSPPTRAIKQRVFTFLSHSIFFCLICNRHQPQYSHFNLSHYLFPLTSKSPPSFLFVICFTHRSNDFMMHEQHL